jgi:hypothetical protein
MSLAHTTLMGEVTRPQLVSVRACELARGRRQAPLVVGWRVESSRFSSVAIKLTSSNALRPSHLVLDESTNWFPSASLKIAALPQCSVFGGIENSTPFAETSS